MLAPTLFDLKLFDKPEPLPYKISITSPPINPNLKLKNKE